MAGRLKSKRIKRPHYKTDDEFVAALRAAGKTMRYLPPEPLCRATARATAANSGLG
jgi:hypothetical protein